MKFKRLNAIMEASKRHLTETGTFGTQIESHLVAHLLVVIYAEYEETLQKIVRKRVQRGTTTDKDVYNFIQSHLKKSVTRLGRIKISDLGGTLERFGTKSKTEFYNEVKDQPSKDAWDKILTNRHAVAHPGGAVQVTFKELEQDYHISLGVLRAFARACGLTPPEIADL